MQGPEKLPTQTLFTQCKGEQPHHFFKEPQADAPMKLFLLKKGLIYLSPFDISHCLSLNISYQLNIG